MLQPDSSLTYLGNLDGWQVLGRGVVKHEYSIVLRKSGQGTILKSVNQVGYRVASVSTSMYNLKHVDADTRYPAKSGKYSL